MHVMAKGGKVESFCSKDNKHKPDCKYYADGGDVDVSGFDPDAYIQQNGGGGTSTQSDTSNNPSDASSFDPDEYIKQNAPNPYASTGSQIGAGLEGAAQGFAGPLATGVELGLSKLGVPNLSAEDIAGREQANPWTHGIGEAVGLGAGLLTGTGEAGLATNLAEHLAPTATTVAGKVGSAALSGLISNGIIQGGNEISKAMLGQGDPQAPVASALLDIGASGLFGGVIGAVTGIPSALTSKLSTAANSWLAGLASAAEGGTPEITAAQMAAEQAEATGASAAINARKIAQQAYEAGVPGLGDIPESIPSSGGVPQAYIDDSKSFTTGQKAYASLLNSGAIGRTTAGIRGGGVLGGAIGGIRGGKQGYDEDGVSGAVWGGIKGAAKGAFNGVEFGAGLGFLAGPVGKFAIKQGLNFTKQYHPEIIAKLLADANTNPEYWQQGANYVDKVSSGADKLTHAINSLFNTSAISGVENYANTRNKDNQGNALSDKQVDDYIANGGYNQNIQAQQQQDAVQQPQVQGYAEGGEIVPMKEPAPSKPSMVQPMLQENVVSKHFPEQNTMLQAAKGRISNYLGSLRPTPYQSKLAFDDAPDQTEQKKSYAKAIRIANDPISVLHHIKNGTLEADHVKHLNALYPEVADHMNKEITQKISEEQLKGEDGVKPTYKVRQGLSMLMGTPLSGEFSQPNIAAAQGVFASKQSQTQSAPVTKNKKNTSSLNKVGDQYKTADQAAQTRAQS